MSPVRRFIPLLLVFCGLAVGIGMIIQMRIGFGDVYPEYSSLRSDPLGTRLLHDSLARIPGLRVERSLEPLQRLQVPGGQGTLVLAGMSPWQWASLNDKQLDMLDTFVRGGGRLVVTFKATMFYENKARRLPEVGGGEEVQGVEGEEAPEPKSGPGGEAEAKQTLKKKTLARLDRIRQLWGVELWGRWILDKDFTGARRHESAPDALPGQLPWKSCTYFEFTQGSDWQVLYSRGQFPCLAELRHGSGSIVLATDSHFLSNEALQAQPPVSLLSWLVGSSSVVVFDEAHLGVVREKGIALLARRYGLLPAMVLVLLAGLTYVWRQGVRFVPPPPEAEDVALEFHPTAGLEALLRRAVPRGRLFSTCREEWRKQARPGDALRVDALPAGEGMQAYNAAVRALRRRGQAAVEPSSPSR